MWISFHCPPCRFSLPPLLDTPGSASSHPLILSFLSHCLALCQSRRRGHFFFKNCFSQLIAVFSAQFPVPPPCHGRAPLSDRACPLLLYVSPMVFSYSPFPISFFNLVCGLSSPPWPPLTWRPFFQASRTPLSPHSSSQILLPCLPISVLLVPIPTLLESRFLALPPGMSPLHYLSLPPPAAGFKSFVSPVNLQMFVVHGCPCFM